MFVFVQNWLVPLLSPRTKKQREDIGFVPYVLVNTYVTYVRMYEQLLSSLLRLHLLMDFNTPSHKLLGLIISRAGSIFRVLGLRSRSLWLFLEKKKRKNKKTKKKKKKKKKKNCVSALSLTFIDGF